MKAGWDCGSSSTATSSAAATVETVVVDEGEGPDTGVPAVQKVLQQDRSTPSSGSSTRPPRSAPWRSSTAPRRCWSIANAGADGLTGSSKYIWRTSFTNGQVALRRRQALATTPEGKKGVYAMAADYAAGEEAIAGFKKGFEEGGGKIVGEAKTPFGTTQDFQPFLAKARSSGAGAVFVFYAGAEAVSFVKQYEEFGLSDSVPLYGSGFLTEGGVLTAQGGAAEGVQTALHYATALDNPANTSSPRPTRPRPASRRRSTPCRPGTPRRCSTRRSRRRARSTATRSSAALGQVGEIADSPRGTWSFENQSPAQEMYLREVEAEGDAVTNVVVESLGQVPPAP